MRSKTKMGLLERFKRRSRNGKMNRNRSINPQFEVLASIRTDPGCVREMNEDCGVHVQPSNPDWLQGKGTLTIIADGMGGHAAGEVASRLAAEIIPVNGASLLDALIAARQSSLADPTPEGRSLLALAEQLGGPPRSSVAAIMKFRLTPRSRWRGLSSKPIGASTMLHLPRPNFAAWEPPARRLRYAMDKRSSPTSAIVAPIFCAPDASTC